MIPFASQRASGQELATHLLNMHENERIEVADVRGAIARDLHGAFAEWAAVAKAVTRCRKYLYSLSISPDPAQEPLSRAQYADYIARVEDRLGLSGQPRAVVFHVKHGRAHCHVIWSRIVVRQRKAVHLAFDREALMTVTREFARDHGLRLPAGYERDPGDPPESAQLSLYEKVQQDRTGLSREERIDEITAAWQHSDSPKAFVQALAALGYILATGKRPYVLVDQDGEMNALPKLIAASRDGARVRSQDVRAFLEGAFPPDSLPTVEQAQAQAARQRAAHEDTTDAPGADDRAEHDRLEAMQGRRREEVLSRAAALRVRHAAESLQCASRHHEEMAALESAFQDETARIRRNRDAHRPRGLAAFLGRVTGMAYLMRKRHERQDRRRARDHEDRKAALSRRHDDERRALQARQRLQRLDMARHARALSQIERREAATLKAAQRRRARARSRDGPVLPDMDEAAWEALPKGALWLDPLEEDAVYRGKPAYPDLHGAFQSAAAGEDGQAGEGDFGTAGQLHPCISGLFDAAADGEEAAFRAWYEDALAAADDGADEDDPELWPDLMAAFRDAAGAGHDDEDGSDDEGSWSPHWPDDGDDPGTPPPRSGGRRPRRQH